jgi:hypothetical protein
MEATVAKIKKSVNAEIWICLREFQGRQYVDIREHFLGDDRQWHPTKKGIMVLQQLLPQVIEGIQALEDVSDLGTVATVPKSAHDEIQMGYRQFGKHQYGEIRMWYWSSEDNEKKPSPKGVTFRVDLVDTLVNALQNAQEHLEAT